MVCYSIVKTKTIANTLAGIEYLFLILILLVIFGSKNHCPLLSMFITLAVSIVMSLLENTNLISREYMMSQVCYLICSFMHYLNLVYQIIVYKEFGLHLYVMVDCLLGILDIATSLLFFFYP